MEELAKKILAKSVYIKNNINSTGIADHIFEYNYIVWDFWILLADSIYANEIEENIYINDYDKAIKEAKDKTKYKTDAELIVKNEMSDKKKNINDQYSLNKRYQKYLNSFEKWSETRKSHQILEMVNDKKQQTNQNL